MPKPEHWRVIALFFLHAVAVGALQTRIPDIQRQLGLSEGALGLTLLGQPIGALLMFFFSSPIIERFGPRRLLLTLLPLMLVSAAAVTVAPNPLLVFVLLAINGTGFSVTNIAINVEADRVEAQRDRRIMNTCHGVWSCGFLVTALLGAVLRGTGVSPAVHLWTLGPLVIAAVWAVAWPLRPAPPRAHAGGEGRRKLAWPTRATLLLVAFGIGAGLLEGAGRTWSIIFMRDSFTVPAVIESLTLPVLLGTMAVGRLVADRFIDRWGAPQVARVLTAIAQAGLLLVVLAPVWPLAIAGFALVGAGICVIYPLMLSAAARLGDRPASENVAATTLIVQLSGLVAPVAVGALAEGFGIRVAFAAFLPLLVLSLLSAGQLREPAP